MSKRILINREECEVRVAFLEDNKLTELHTERIDEQTVVNNVYRGRVQDVVPGLQAAFIDVGLERNLFLHFMDVRSEALVLDADNQKEMLREAARTPIPGRIQRPGRRPRQDPKAPQGAAPIKKGQNLIIQVVKDEIGGKAPRASTNLSLAGRYLVMLPFPSQEGGVSRKIAQGQDRFRLKKLLSELKTKDHSFIVRTAGLDQGEEALRRDAETLEDLWETILTKYKKLKGPGLIHNDHSLISRMVRDAFPPDFEEVVCDDAADAAALRIELADLMPGKEERVSVHEGVESLFDRFGVEKQIEASLAEKIFLPSGGSIVIDENEALTAIDVNTGRFTGRRDQEKTSLKTNMEACVEIARQLRVRDLGGIIVCDFIDMLSRGHQEQLQEEMRRHLTSDRSRTTIGRASDFGLMILTRKRHRMSLQKQTYDSCPYCGGSGFVRNTDQVQRRMKYDIRRVLKEHPGLRTLVVSAHPQFIDSLNNRYRAYVERLRSDAQLELVYRPLAEMHLEDYQLTPIDIANTEGLQLPAARVPVDAAIAIPKSYTEPVGKASARYDEEEDEEEENGEDEPEAATDGAAATNGEEGERSGRKRRRRRESSSERRARRKGRKEPGEDGATPGSVDEDEADEPIAPQPAVAAESQDDAAGDEAAGADEGEEQPKRRTRRGSRGGRGRRRKDQDEAPEVAAAGAGEPATRDEPKEEPKPAPAKPPLAPLKVPALAIKKSSSLLLGFLDEIERAVGSMKGAPEPIAEPAKAEAPEPEPVAAPEPEAAPSPAPEPEEEKKPATRPTTRSRTAASRTRKKAGDEPKPEPDTAGEEKKKPARRTTGTRRKAASTSKSEEGAAESASPAKASTRRTAANKADGAEKPKKAAASRAKSSTGTAKSKASTAKKAPTTRRKKTTKEASE